MEHGPVRCSQPSTARVLPLLSRQGGAAGTPARAPGGVQPPLARAPLGRGTGLLLFAFVLACSPVSPRPSDGASHGAAPAHELPVFEASAYTIRGKTASGGRARKGTCAADPRVLPLGSRIRIHEAGAFSGEYVVTDTGKSVKGREIDIFVGSSAEARRFGRRKVRVEVLRPEASSGR